MLFLPLSDQFDRLTGAQSRISAQQGKLNTKPCRFVLKKRLYPRVFPRYSLILQYKFKSLEPII